MVFPTVRMKFWVKGEREAAVKRMNETIANMFAWLTVPSQHPQSNADASSTSDPRSSTIPDPLPVAIHPRRNRLTRTTHVTALSSPDPPAPDDHPSSATPVWTDPWPAFHSAVEACTNGPGTPVGDVARTFAAVLGDGDRGRWGQERGKRRREMEVAERRVRARMRDLLGGDGNGSANAGGGGPREAEIKEVVDQLRKTYVEETLYAMHLL
ncbi:hypothetical protein HKX48_005654 [Thoreauomyces humboldtii]|nr:hypothetical protein HKX48_005654 [Thoreauomyces humboldtii]